MSPELERSLINGALDEHTPQHWEDLPPREVVRLIRAETGVRVHVATVEECQRAFVVASVNLFPWPSLN